MSIQETGRDLSAMRREKLLTVSDLLANTLNALRKTDLRNIKKFEAFIAEKSIGLVVIIDEEQAPFVLYDEFSFSASEKTGGEPKMVRTLVVNASSEFSLNDRVVFSEMQKAILEPFMKGDSGMNMASGAEMLQLLKTINPGAFGVRRADRGRTPIFFTYAQP